MVYVPALRCKEHKIIVAEMENFPDVLVFWKLMTHHSVQSTCRGKFDMPMEFPKGFINRYEKAFGELTSAKLQRSCGNTQWPIVVTKRNTTKMTRVFTYGADGWASFVADNDINSGELLVFLHLGNSAFIVYVFPKCADCPWCVRGVEPYPFA